MKQIVYCCTWPVQSQVNADKVPSTSAPHMFPDSFIPEQQDKCHRLKSQSRWYFDVAPDDLWTLHHVAGGQFIVSVRTEQA